MTKLFDPLSISDNHFLLASHLPPGKALKGAFDPNDDFGKLFLGLAIEFYRFQVLEKKLYGEMDIMEANELLVDWEKSVGLPDSCFKQTTDLSLAERRKHIYAKFSKFGGVQKEEDFLRVADFFGFEVTIQAAKGIATFPLSYPIFFFSTAKAVTHTIIITIISDSPATSFPLSFPIPFSTDSKNFIKCIFRKLAPANVQVLVLNEDEVSDLVPMVFPLSFPIHFGVVPI